MTKALLKEILRTISRTKARFLSIIAIVALGVAFFVGTNVTPNNMIKTADDYFQGANLMDISVVSTAGLMDSDVYSIMTRYNRVIHSFMPVKAVDGLLYMDGKGLVDIDGSAFTCRAISMDFSKMVKNFMEANPDYPNYKDGVVKANDMSYINRLTLLEGRFPQKEGECVVDESALSTPDEFEIGKIIELRGDNEDLSHSLTAAKFEIVGIIRTPTFINFERGHTTIGSGKLGTFIYAPQEMFLASHYSQLFLRLRNSAPENFSERSTYSERYYAYVNDVIAQLEALSQERLPIRRTNLRNELVMKLADGDELISEKEREMEQSLAAAAQQMEDVRNYALNGDNIIAQKKAEFEQTFNEAQREWYNSQNAFNAAAEEYNQKAAEFAEARVVMDANPNYRTEFDAAGQELARSAETIKSAEAQIKRMEQVISTIHSFMETMNENSPWEDIMSSLTEVGMDRTIIDKLKSATVLGLFEDAIGVAEPSLQQYTRELDTQRQQLNAAKLDYILKSADYLAKKGQVDQLDKLAALEREMAQKNAELTANQQALNFGEAQLSQAQAQAQMDLLIAQQQVAQAKAAYPTVQQTYDQKKREAEQALANARKDLERAQKTLDGLDKTRWMVTGREALPGNTSYQQNADNIRVLAIIFPLVFFAVAALVVLTTVARMVDEERAQMGTLKALGYEEKSIALKYIVYALLASFIGACLGFAIGFTAIPIAVAAAFGIMFDMPPIVLSFSWSLAAIGLGISLLCSVGAAFIASRREMQITPAMLLRSKAPKAGRRVLLERIPFIWNMLSFTGKVTVRNLLRNKRRFITTIIGITGTTALLLASFGLGDSIGAIINYQYGDGGISRQDLQMVLADPVDIVSENDPVMTRLGTENRLSNALPVAMQVLQAGGDRNSSEPTQEVNVLVPAQPSRLNDFIDLRARNTGEPLFLNDYGVIVTQMFAERADVSAGDRIFIQNNDGSYIEEVRVVGVAENYTFNYIYMNQTVYEALFKVRPEYNMVFGQLSGDLTSLNEGELNDAKAKLSTDLMNIAGINAVVYTTQIVDSFANIVRSLDYVILVFIIAAAALAFVVLFNLSNININERMREIATVKVLGFYDGELSAYIYRENIILTVLGMITGVGAGIFLHSMLADIVRINVVMLGQNLEWQSYLYALLITAGFTVIVNILMHRKLKKVSMVESLKSVE